MSSAREKPKAKLVIGVMYPEKEKPLLQEIIATLEKEFGKITEKSEEYLFDYTNFYEKEFGVNLRKMYLCFGSFDIESLAEAKLSCFELENKYMKKGKRLFNLDPGYATENSFVLASFKIRAHRIYIKKGVYADLELVYENKSWQSLKWTFPDLKNEKIKEFLEKIKN